MTKIECKEIFSMLSDYLDQELPESLCEEVGSHIQGCAPCVQFVESLKKSIELCRTAPRNEVAGTEPRPLSEEDREQLRDAYARFQQSLTKPVS